MNHFICQWMFPVSNNAQYELVETSPAPKKGDSSEHESHKSQPEATTASSDRVWSQVTDVPVPLSKTAAEREKKVRAKARVVVEHLDIIGDEFWEKRPWILSGRAGKLPR